MGLVARLDCFAALAMTVLGIVLLSWSLRCQVTRRPHPKPVIASRKAARQSMGLVSRLDCFATLAMTVLGIVLLSWSLRSKITRRPPLRPRHCEPQSGAAIHEFGLTAGLLRCARNDGVGDCFVELVLAEQNHPQIPTPNPSLRAAKRRGNPWVWSHAWIASLYSQ